MSLLLDALKRAEDAKRAKAEAAAASSHATEDGTPALVDASAGEEILSPSPTAPKDAAPTAIEIAESRELPPAFPVLSLEIVDTRPADPVLLSGLNPAAALIPNSADEPEPRTSAMTMEELLATELGIPPAKQIRPAPVRTSAATAAFRAARTSRVPPEPILPLVDSPPLELYAIETGSRDVPTRVEPSSAPATPNAALDSSNREAIKNAFAVKQSAKTSSKAKWALPLIGVLLSGLGAGGWYVWNEMNRFARPAIARTPAPTPSSVAPTPAAPAPGEATPSQPVPSGQVAVAPQTMPVVAAATEQVAVAPKTMPGVAAPAAQVDAPLPPLLPPPAAQVREARAPAMARVEAMTQREAIARRIEALPSVNADSAAKVKLTLAKPAGNPPVSVALSAGYAALSSGDYPLAKRRYAEAIAANAHSADAHLGFATAAARGGESADLALAIRHYQRVLEIDPRNSTANAALIVLAGGTSNAANGASRSVTEQEAALRRLVSQDPNAADVHFLLGNLYAENRRWRDAQQAYFEAARLQPQNADYNYNLAVSLDHLGQGGAAADFYRRALAATSKGQFDTTAVDRRITALLTKQNPSTNGGIANR